MIINFTLIKDKVGVGVSGVVLNQKGQILLVQRNDSKAWSLPGGIVENGESPDQAVVREVKEETGLDVDIVRLTGIYIRYLWKKNLLFVYKCQVKGGVLTLPDGMVVIQDPSFLDSNHKMVVAATGDWTYFWVVFNTDGSINVESPFQRFLFLIE